MTTKELADRHRVGVSLVKTLLREAPEFAGEDFQSPDKALDPRHIHYVDEHLEELRRRRQARDEDVVAVAESRLPPRSVAQLAAASASAAARAPRPGGEHRLFVHQEVFDFLGDLREERRLKSSVKRLMREMLVEGRSQRRVKGTKGVNAGWLRAPLGDNGGFHYYLWHALQGHPPVKALPLERGDVAIRAIRHHDATTRELLDGGSPGDYVALDAREYVEAFEDGASDADVLSVAQRDAFQSGAAASITKGHPGAGKTTLQLERTRRLDGRLLFLTFGASQRAEAEKWLRTYTPAGLEVHAWTHEELFRALDPDWAPPPPVGEAIAELERALQGEPRLGPWRHHMTALYAELRAHYWGRALPIEFRGMGAGVDAASRERSFRERRAPVIGEAAVEAALRAAAALSAKARLRLFGDLERVARIAEALAARGAEALPEELRSLGAVLVDEVQDLTLVEALVGVLVAHAAARGTGMRPFFHAAGDEGQTVRATDFDWGELKDLIGLLLAAPDEFQLPGNVRSPRTLTRVVNRSWDLYKAFGKAQRPRGYAEAEVDESAVGSVLWVDARQDLEPVLAAIAKIPGAALVYPDLRVPPEVRAAADRAGVIFTLSAPDAKGLDFRVVFVLDAGRLAHKVWLAKPAVSSKADDAVLEIENRIGVDAIRVAISRSTEVLVFVERDLDEHARRRLTALCSDEHGLFEGVVTDASVDRLEVLVDLDAADRTELVTELLAEFDRTFPDDPATGLRIAERARQWLGDSNRAGAVRGRLREQVYLVHGRALLRTATLGTGAPAAIADLLRRANAALNLAQEKELAQLCLDARDALAPDHAPVEKGLARIVERAADPHALGAAEALAVLRSFLSVARANAEWYDLRDWSRLLDALHAMDVPAARHPDLAVARQALLEDAVRWALAPGTGDSATKIAARAIAGMKEPPTELRAELAEREKRWADAIELFQRAGLPADALRISRTCADDARRSAELARQAGDGAQASLERLARMHADLADLDPEALTDAERDKLVRAVREKLGGRKRSPP